MDDYGFDGGGNYSLWNDTPDQGSSWDFNGGSQGSQLNFGGGGSGGGFDTSWLQPYLQPQQPTPMPMPQARPQAAVPQQGGGNANPWMGAAMGSLGPMAGLIGSLINGGQGATSGPKPNTQQKANMGYANQQAQLGAGGNLPAQQMQMSLLQALQSGQGLPPGYQQLIEQAYQPQMGDLYSQAAAAGRARGFHDAPATSPVGSAILGPGLSNLQGQMAQSKLGMMQSLPALYNQPIATQGNFAQNYLQSAQNPTTMQQTSQQPMAPQIGQAVGGLISGGAQGYNAAVGQNQQQQTLDSLLKSLQQKNATGGMSQVPMAQGGIVTQPTNALIGEAGPEAVIPLAGDQGRVLQNILRQGAASRGPQPNPQPSRNPGSLLDILRLLGITPGPDRQIQLGSR